MSALGDLLEVRSVRAPLGMVLLDPLDDRPVRHLAVTAHDRDGSGVATTAVPTQGGYGFPRLPGLPPLVDGADAPPVEVAVLVTDPQGRYVPSVFVVGAPTRRPPAVPADGRGMYLFRSADAVAVDGFAAVRADLVEDGTGSPAAHAVLRVGADGATGVGLAGSDGRVVALLPLPTPTSPDGPRAQWTLSVTVRWRPAAQEQVAELPIPTLASLLAQPEAAVVDLGAPVLRAGEDLALRSGDDSRLRIRTA